MLAVFATLASSFAARFAIASPIPREVPVTNRVLSARLMAAMHQRGRSGACANLDDEAF